MSELTMPVLTDHGFPTGDLAPEFWSKILGEVNGLMEQEGWNQPPQLLTVLRPAVALAQMPQETYDRMQDAIGDSELQTPIFGLHNLGVMDGHPIDALQGQHLDQDSSAAIVALEATASQISEEAVSQKNVRIITAVTRDGQTWTLMQVEGHDPFLAGYEDPSGMEGLDATDGMSEGMIPLALAAFVGVQQPDRVPTPLQVIRSVVWTNLAYRADEILVVDDAPDDVEGVFEAGTAALTVQAFLHLSATLNDPTETIDKIAEITVEDPTDSDRVLEILTETLQGVSSTLGNLNWDDFDLEHLSALAPIREDADPQWWGQERLAMAIHFAGQDVDRSIDYVDRIGERLGTTGLGHRLQSMVDAMTTPADS